MKKSMLIFGVLTASIGLMAFGYINKNTFTFYKQETTSCQSNSDKDKTESIVSGIPQKDLVYNIDSRFLATTTKEKLQNAISITELVPERGVANRTNFQNSRLSILHGNSETTEVGESDILNIAQLEFIKTIDYSMNLRVTSLCSRILEDGTLEDDSLVYYVTIIPEKEADYQNGQEALIKYLRENSKNETIGLTKDKLKPGRILFTVNKEAEFIMWS